MIEPQLVAFLKASPELSAIEGRFYPIQGDEDAALPFIVYKRIPSSNFDPTQDGPSGLVRGLTQLAIVSESYLQAAELAHRVRVCKGGGSQQLNGFYGFMGSLNVQSVFVIDEWDDWHELSDGTGKVLYLRCLKLETFFQENVEQ